MSSFWKSFFASLLAIVIGGIGFCLLSLFIFVGMLVAAGSGEKHRRVIEPHSILRIDLSQPFVERASGSAMARFDYSTFGFRDETTLYEAVSSIERAAEDPRIDGIYLEETVPGSNSLSVLYELRQALDTFRESGKFVVSYADLYSQGGYYLASAGDRIYLHPQGGLAWQGLASNVVFYKRLLDKFGVRAELIRHGKFKGAGEPFVREQLSDENRLQIESMLGSMWNFLVGEIAGSRGIAADSLRRYAERLAVATPCDAVRLGLVDSLFYRDRMRAELAVLSGGDADEELRIVDLSGYKSVGRRADRTTGDEIAVVYADGDMVDAGDRDREIVGNALARRLAGIRRDDDVKAVVLRINSPGGSALAADIIWREVSLMQQVKPVIVSMGSYAASGGYYMACGAEYIVATPTTLTGSIGVFGLTFDVSEGAREYLGLTTEAVRTAPAADMGNLFRPLTPAERLYIQNGVDTVYARFVELVAQGRGMAADRVDALAGGRVWTGSQAVENGLADAAGTLRDAVRIAAAHAGLEAGDYVVRQYPEPGEPSFWSLVGTLSGSAAMKIAGYDRRESDALARLGTEALRIREMVANRGIRAAVPYRIEIQY